MYLITEGPQPEIITMESDNAHRRLKTNQTYFLLARALEWSNAIMSATDELSLVLGELLQCTKETVYNILIQIIGALLQMYRTLIALTISSIQMNSTSIHNFINIYTTLTWREAHPDYPLYVQAILVRWKREICVSHHIIKFHSSATDDDRKTKWRILELKKINRRIDVWGTVWMPCKWILQNTSCYLRQYGTIIGQLCTSQSLPCCKPATTVYWHATIDGIGNACSLLWGRNQELKYHGDISVLYCFKSMRLMIVNCFQWFFWGYSHIHTLFMYRTLVLRMKPKQRQRH